MSFLTLEEQRHLQDSFLGQAFVRPSHAPGTGDEGINGIALAAKQL